MIARSLKISPNEITDISEFEKGMTNRSYLFLMGNERYIIRIPGEGTDKLIDRRQEAENYRAIKGCGICDDPMYLNSETGIKIVKYLENVEPCDPWNEEEVRSCMRLLHDMHQRRLSVPHTFDIFGQIEYYETLHRPSEKEDYEWVRQDVFSMKEYIDNVREDWCLTHIDAVPDNFLFHTTKDGRRMLQLTDWEYAGMQDPHVDIAMFCIYSMYGKDDVDRTIDMYFDGQCDDRVRIKIYCYIAACGLLWWNWCELKKEYGVEFGEYAEAQYNFARDYVEYIKRLGAAE